MSTKFENEEILNSALLVDMVYIDERKLKHIRDLEQLIIDDAKNKISKLAKDYGFESISDLNSEYFTKDLIDYIWGNIKEDVKSSEEINSINQIRNDLYQKKKIQNHTNFIEMDTEVDIKREVLLYLIEQENSKLKSKIKPNGIELYFKMGLTSIDLENIKNKKLAEIRDENKNLWSQFRPLDISQEIISKYSDNYDVKTAFGLKANFENGYVDIGVDGLEKDTSFMVGYIKNEAGEDVLNIVFRGTEDKSMDTLKYMTNRYPNMERQYHRLEPILEDILKQEQEKPLS